MYIESYEIIIFSLSMLIAVITGLILVKELFVVVVSHLEVNLVFYHQVKTDNILNIFFAKFPLNVK